MKRIIFLCCLLAHTYNFAEFTSGFLTQDITNSGFSERYTTRFYSDTQSYAFGGLTFTYPTFWITAPRVTVSIQLTETSVPGDTYTAVVSANSDTSTTVLVYRIAGDGSGIVEGFNGEVLVTIISIEDVSSLV